MVTDLSLDNSYVPPRGELDLQMQPPAVSIKQKQEPAMVAIAPLRRSVKPQFQNPLI